MMSDEDSTVHWWRHPIYKYGMLPFFAFLTTHYVRRLMTGGDESARVGYQIGLVSIVMLFATHISHFLTPQQQRRANPFQLALLVACMGFVVVQSWRH